MNLTQKLLGVAALGLALINVSAAQEAAQEAAPTARAGLLGVQYVEAGFGYLDVNHSDRGGYQLDTRVNVPVTANLDLSAGFAHSWAENNDSFYSNHAHVAATGYITEGAFRPFVTAEVGYVWIGSGDDNFAVWDLGTGVEYSINDTTAVTAFVCYSDSFEGVDDGSFAGTLSVNHWFTSSIAGSIGATWYEFGDVGYGVSAIFKF